MNASAPRSDESLSIAYPFAIRSGLRPPKPGATRAISLTTASASTPRLVRAKSVLTPSALTAHGSATESCEPALLFFGELRAHGKDAFYHATDQCVVTLDNGLGLGLARQGGASKDKERFLHDCFELNREQGMARDALPLT